MPGLAIRTDKKSTILDGSALKALPISNGVHERDFSMGLKKRYAILPSMPLYFSSNAVGMDGPNFNFVEIDKYWDRL
jgi:hypothetical protein